MKHIIIYHIIVNPASQSGKGQRVWSEFKKLLLDRGVSYKEYFSGKPGDVTRIVHELTSAAGTQEDPVRLLILGGDGTFNEALQGIADFDRVLLGLIPTGSSNDLARALKLPSNPDQIMSRILDDNPIRKMDLGLVEFHDAITEPSGDQTIAKRYFAVSCGIGFDAAVCHETFYSPAKKLLNHLRLGKLIYLLVALKQLVAARHDSCVIKLDADREHRHSKFLFCAFMVHPYEGGGFKFCPDADDQDGLLNLCTIGNLPLIKKLFALPAAFLGKHSMFKGVYQYTAARVRFRSQTPLWIHTDGEVDYMASSITVSCLKKKLLMMM